MQTPEGSNSGSNNTNIIAGTTRGRSANWTPAEERFLCQAWCRAFDDVVTGTNRSGNTLESHIMKCITLRVFGLL